MNIREFWLFLHSLASELRDEGESDYERALAVAAMLEAESVSVGDNYLADLEVVSSAPKELNAVTATE